MPTNLGSAGEVACFNGRWGFIQLESGRKIFMHIKAEGNKACRDLVVGDRVRFEISQSTRGKPRGVWKTVAVHVRRLSVRVDNVPVATSVRLILAHELFVRKCFEWGSLHMRFWRASCLKIHHVLNLDRLGANSFAV